MVVGDGVALAEDVTVGASTVVESNVGKSLGITVAAGASVRAGKRVVSGAAITWGVGVLVKLDVAATVRVGSLDGLP